jgi:hypothetical protein
MNEDIVLDQQLELRARVAICLAYARAIEDRLLNSDGDAQATEFAARIADHQAAIERLAGALLGQPQPLELLV